MKNFLKLIGIITSALAILAGIKIVLEKFGKKDYTPCDDLEDDFEDDLQEDLKSDLDESVEEEGEE